MTTISSQDHVYHDIPKSSIEAVSIRNIAKGKDITKAAVQAYIASFLNTKGSRRNILNFIAPFTGQYITDKSYEQTNDATKRHIQLARYFGELKERLPAIIIVDSGATPQSSLGGNHKRYRDGTNIYIQINNVMTVPLDIAIAILGDEAGCNNMLSALSLIFGELRTLVGGNVLRSPKPGENWEVRLPLTFSTSAVSSQNVTDDQKDVIWNATLSIEAEYEGVEILKYTMDQMNFVPYSRSQEFGYTRDDAPDQADLGGDFYDGFLTGPNTMKLNSPTYITFREGQYPSADMQLRISDYRIALFDPDTFLVTPRRPGAFTVYLEYKPTLEVLTSLDITVIL